MALTDAEAKTQLANEAKNLAATGNAKGKVNKDGLTMEEANDPKYWSNGKYVGVDQTPKNSPIVTSDQAVDQSAKIKADINSLAGKSSTPDYAQQAQDLYSQQKSLTDSQQSTLAQRRTDAVASIQAAGAQTKSEAVQSQAKETGAASTATARMGGYLGGTASGQAYMTSLQSSHQAELSKLDSQLQSAITQANQAYDDKDYELAQKSLDNARNFYNDVINAKSKQQDDLYKAAQLQKLQTDEAASTVDNIAKSGTTEDKIPTGYFESLDKSHNLEAGTSKMLFEASREAYATAKTKSDIEQASSIANVVKSFPAGTPVKIGTATYYGTGGTGTLEVATDGMGRIASVDQSTGKVSVSNIGYVGKKTDGWQFQIDTSGNAWSFNTKTGQLLPAHDGSKSSGGSTGIDIQSVIPDGSNGGQCGRYVNQLTGLSFGDTLDSKVAITKQAGNADIGTPENPIQPGDAVVQAIGGSTGHVAVVQSVYVGPDGKTYLKLSESNLKYDEKVTNGRTILADDATVKGFAHPIKLDPRLTVGTDSPKFTPKGSTASKSATSEDNVKAIGDAIIAGTQSPDLKGLYSATPAVKAYLASKGFDQAGALTKWNAEQKFIASMNSTKQQSLMQSVTFAKDSLDLVDQYADAWDGYGFGPLNKANIAIAKSGALGQDAKQKAVLLDSQIADLQGELAVVYKGGGTPTDSGLKQSKEMLDSEWDAKTIKAATELARKNLSLRLKAISEAAPIMGSLGEKETPAPQSFSNAKNMTEADVKEAEADGWKITKNPDGSYSGSK